MDDDGRRTDGRRTMGNYTISSPWAFGSGELTNIRCKGNRKRQQNYNSDTISNELLGTQQPVNLTPDEKVLIRLLLQSYSSPFFFFFFFALFVSFSVLRPRSTIKVMSERSVDLTTLFLRKPPFLQYLVNILSPSTDSYSSWIRGRGRLAVEIFSWPNFHENVNNAGRSWGSACNK